jgi:hypothetical protein
MGDIVAFLATRLSAAQTDIRHAYPIMSVSGQDRGEVIYDGATRPFRIITREEQLRGLHLHTFEVLDHATGHINLRMIEIANSRIMP